MLFFSPREKHLLFLWLDFVFEFLHEFGENSTNKKKLYYREIDKQYYCRHKLNEAPVAVMVVVAVCVMSVYILPPSQPFGSVSTVAIKCWYNICSTLTHIKHTTRMLLEAISMSGEMLCVWVRVFFSTPIWEHSLNGTL